MSDAGSGDGGAEQLETIGDYIHLDDSVDDVAGGSGGGGSGSGTGTRDGWGNYSGLRDNGLGNDEIERNYDFMDTAFIEGLKDAESKLGRKPEHILDLACGAGDGCIKFILEKYPALENKIDAIDIDSGQIKNGIEQFGDERVNWICSDATSYDFNEKKYDLITAVWLHNFLHTEEQQQIMAERINELLSDDGVVVFLGPSPAYRTLDTAGEKYSDWNYKKKESGGGWYTVWRQHERRFSRCIFSVGETRDDGSYTSEAWQPMTTWDPLYLAIQFYNDFLNISFVDTKGIYCQHFAHNPIEQLLEPWFDVLVGKRK